MPTTMAIERKSALRLSTRTSRLEFSTMRQRQGHLTPSIPRSRILSEDSARCIVDGFVAAGAVATGPGSAFLRHILAGKLLYCGRGVVSKFVRGSRETLELLLKALGVGKKPISVSVCRRSRDVVLAEGVGM